MEKRTIWVKPSCFTPEIEMIIPIPEDRDAEEYIDEFLDTILCEDLSVDRGNVQRWNQLFQFWEQDTDKPGNGTFQFGALFYLVETVSSQ